MRIRSLNKDKRDFDQLRNHRMAHFGFAISNEFYQQQVFFWTREGAQLNLIGHYRGASAFLICNGPSLVNGKFDLNLLKRPGVITYGINNGPRTIRPNFWTCVDDPQRFLKSIWLDPCITKFVPHSFAEKPYFDNEKWEKIGAVVGQCPNVIYFHRNEKFVAERFLIEDTLNWGNSGDNGGGRSVMLPSIKILFLLGFRKVYLLGADFKMSETYTYHFDEQRHKGAVNGNMSTYDKLKNEYFPALKPYFEAEGFYLYNCNPESELKVFDYVSFEDAIAEATSNLGNVDNERTWGMYSKPDERPKWKQEPPEQMKAHLVNLKNRPMAPVCGNITHQEPIQENKERKEDIEQPLVDNRIPNEKEVEHTPLPKHIVPVVEKVNIIPPSRRPSLPPIPPQLPQPTNQKNQRRVISNIPCGGMSFGSSGAKDSSIAAVVPNQAKPQYNITIKDDGN